LDPALQGGAESAGGASLDELIEQVGGLSSPISSPAPKQRPAAVTPSRLSNTGFFGASMSVNPPGSPGVDQLCEMLAMEPPSSPAQRIRADMEARQ
jgi:hypothetical protein